MTNKTIEFQILANEMSVSFPSSFVDVRQIHSVSLRIVALRYAYMSTTTNAPLKYLFTKHIKISLKTNFSNSSSLTFNFTTSSALLKVGGNDVLGRNHRETTTTTTTTAAAAADDRRFS